ncbi:MAG TPA: MYG1 family protein, partial [Spirochaetota bacterium]
YCPWQDIVVRETDALYVLFPSATGDWRIRAVPDRIGAFTVRKYLPKVWGGKTPEELAAITGVADATFCHQSLFIAGAASRAGAEKLLALALR